VPAKNMKERQGSPGKAGGSTPHGGLVNDARLHDGSVHDGRDRPAGEGNPSPLSGDAPVLASLREDRGRWGEQIGSAGHSAAEATVARRLIRELDQGIALLEGREAERDLISVICHDLKDPLASIIMGTGFLRKTLPPDDASGRRVLEAVLRSADRMTSLVNDFHDLAKLEAARLPIDARASDVVPLLRDAVAAKRANAAEKNVTLEADLPVAATVAICDSARVAQVVDKILANAIRFTAAGGRVTVRAAKTDGVIRVAVEDTGRGIAADHLPTIFDYAANARRTPRDGPGLGLAIARGIVEAQGGTIAVESRMGEGSVFTFTLRAG
jgi:signal transduction histidine kinase